MSTSPKFQNAALLILRVIVAIVFMHAGLAKWFLWSVEPMAGSPMWLHYVLLLLTIVEPLGAVAVVIGFLTRWAGAGFSVIMVGAILVSHFMMNVPFFTAPQVPGWDSNLILLGGTLVLTAFGAGRWSVDAFMKRAAR